MARVIDRGKKKVLDDFVNEHTASNTKLYMDDVSVCGGIDRPQEPVKHSQECVHIKIHTNRVELFWSMLKCAHKRVFRRLSVHHIRQYVFKFAGQHNIRDRNTIDQFAGVVAGLVGRRLRYQDLVDPEGTPLEAA